MSPLGSGSVALNPGGGTYDPDTPVTLTAIPAPGWRFDHWSGDAEGTSSSVTIIMDSDKRVTANFNKPEVREYILQTTDNAVRVKADTSWHDSPYTCRWEEGTSHTVEVPFIMVISEGSRYKFTGWSGKITSEDTLISIHVDSSSAGEYKANYNKQYTLEVETEPAGLISHIKVPSPDDPPNWYDEDREVSLTALEAVDTLRFKYWIVDADTIKDSSITIKMDTSHSTTAIYGTIGTPEIVLSLSLSDSICIGDTVLASFKAENKGEGTAYDVDVRIGGFEELEETSRSGMWKVDSLVMGDSISGNILLKAIKPGHVRMVLTAYYKDGLGRSYEAEAVGEVGIFLKITIGTSPSGLPIMVDGSTFDSPKTFGWAKGTSRDVRAVSPVEEGEGKRYVFEVWNDGDTTNPRVITVGNSNADYIANYKVQYYLEADVEGRGNVELSPEGPWYDSNDTVFVKAIPDSGYYFAGWSGDLSGVKEDTSLVMDGPKNITAKFETSYVTVRLEPSRDSVRVDSSFKLDIVIDNVTNLGGFECEIVYPPDKVQVDSIRLGDFLGSTGNTASPVGPDIDNDVGMASCGAFSFGDNPGPSGGGILATVYFSASDTGRAAISLQDVQVTDKGGSVIPINIGEDALIAIGPSPPPEVVLAVVDTSGSPGGVGEVPICLDNKIDVAGVEFALNYDPDILTLDSVKATTRTQDMDTFGWNVIEPGKVKLLIADMGGDLIGPDSCSIAEVSFKVSQDVSSDTTISLSLSEVVLSDPVGRGIPTRTVDGTFTVKIGIKGDLNKDDEKDVRDVIILVNIILERIDPTPYQLWAADVNEDGAMNVIDVIKLVRIILGLEEGPKAAKGVSSPAAVEMTGTEGGVDIAIASDVPIAGAQFSIKYDPKHIAGGPELTGRSSGMVLGYNIEEGRLRILIYSLDGRAIPPGKGPVVSIPFEVEDVGHVILEEAILSDADARAIPADIMDRSLELRTQKAYQLWQNSPNPFNSETSIRYYLPEAGKVTLEVWDVLGRRVRRLVDGHQRAGYHTVRWDGRDELGNEVSSGIYLYRIRCGDYTDLRKMLLVR